VPENAVVIDIDLTKHPGVQERMAESGLRLGKDFQGGQVTRSGGVHIPYRTNGRDARNTSAFLGVAGLDLRTKDGYVIAWQPYEWVSVTEWAEAPDWVYRDGRAREEGIERDPEAPMSTHDEIIDRLGSMAGKVDMPKSGWLAILKEWRETGVIVALDPKEPWTDKDLNTLAATAAGWSGKDPDWWSEYGITRENVARVQAAWDRLTADVRAGRYAKRLAAAVEHGRRVALRAATSITMRRVRWLWDGRLALGTLSLLGGREGQGKSLWSLTLAAQITRGELPGEHFGIPRNVIVVAAEDAWDFTIVPRLTANGADLSRVFQAISVTSEDLEVPMALPHDLASFEKQIAQNDVAFVVFDPLISRLDAALDSHKDAEVRRALEPLVAIAGRTKAHFQGLIHINKTATSDPLTALMASRAFPAVARSVLFITRDPEESGVRLLGQPKNNLGKEDWPTQRFRVETVVVGEDPEDGKPIEAGRIVRLDDTERTIEDALSALSQPRKSTTKTGEAAHWLLAYLRRQAEGRASSSQVHDAAKAAGHGETPLRRARESLGVEITNEGFPKVTYWGLPARLLGLPDED